MPYNNEYTWNERTNLPYPRLTVGIDRRDPDGAVTIMQVRNGVNYLCDDYRGPFADRNDKQLIEMAKQLVTAVGVDRIRPHYYTEENGHTKVHVGKDIHITEWANAPELCSALRFSRFLNRDGQQLFQVRNGQRIIENYADGSRLVKDVQTVDDTHFYVGSRFCHIQQYANQCFKRGCYVEPEHPQPGDKLDRMLIYQIPHYTCEYRFTDYDYAQNKLKATDYRFHRQDNGLLVWQGAYLTRSAETLLPWRAVANALNDLIEQHELIAAIDPKKLPQVEEQLSFELPDGSPPSAENNRLEKDDFLTPEKQETVIRSALPVAEYNAPQMDDGSVITDEEVNLALAAGSNFENSKFRIYQQLTTTQGDHAAFLKKEYGSGGRSWDYQSGAHGWVDHGPAGLKLILTNEEGRFERRLPWRAAAKRIAYLIEMQRFLTPQELEQYPAWAAEQREPASAVRDEPSTIPESRPICAEGSVVYLEDDHRFTVERIGQFDVHLRDEEVPLFGCAISREEFQRQLDANPRNGGMMLSEQQRTALVQTQTEQALSYIEDYLKDEFEITEPDFSDLTRIDLGYTTTEDEKHVIQVYADLEHCTVTKLVDDTLQSEGVKIRVKKQSGQLLYKAADLDGTWIPADALGDGFTLAGLESAIKNKSGILDTNHSTSIAELYQELTTNYPQSCDTSVRLTSRQICSASKRGVLLQIHDSSGNPAKLMIDNSHIHTTPDGSVSADIGAAFSYDITYDDGTHGTIRGTDLIRQIDEENLTQPLIVSLTADQIMAMSLRGVTVHLPQYHIERLFIPEHYVQRNVEHGSCAISLYPGWQYSYVPIGSEKTRKSISGAELAQSLGGVVQVGTSESSLARRVANVERRAGIANAQELGKLLGSMADNGLHLAADFDKQISAYQREEMKLRNEVAELRSKSKTYAATAHNLQACRTYKSVWLEYTSKPLAQKDTFYKKNEAALQTYCRAASQLDKMGISLGTEPEKVRQLVTETESRIADLIAELEKVRKSNRAIQEDKEKVEQIQSG